MSLLEKVNSPEDIRGFSVKQLETLCSEIRQYMIGCCATNPGHLGSSLGAVELAVALHYTYNTPTDKIVWDVGHQAYAHKIITGRREQFRTNRTYGGNVREHLRLLRRRTLVHIGQRSPRHGHGSQALRQR